MVSKDSMRQAHTAARARLRAQPERKQLIDGAVAHHTLTCVNAFGAAGTNIAAYNPLPSEPGPPDFAALLSAQARTVFLPISLPGGQLAWAEARAGAGGSAGGMVAGALGVAEPVGPRFTSGVLRSCGLVVVPALAVDRGGMRLGKGAGYYDRALARLRGPGGRRVPVAAVVYADEVVGSVPHDAHDIPVDAVITPDGFFAV